MCQYNYPLNITNLTITIHIRGPATAFKMSCDYIKLLLAIDTAAKTKTRTEKLSDQMKSEMPVQLQHFHCPTYVTLLASEQRRKLTKPKCLLHLQKHITYGMLN